ncbi:MAG: PQQ-binding-like beta-propeller repeat protein [Prosthecobacter sp.]|uniref:outer membrane protein assembly factor BamB family protein n=1 Tax=Prosthecobacter sp. TaxID=1965333 RepID=UPI0038FEAA6C
MKVCLTTALLFSFSLHAADSNWPRFRGPNGSGVSEAGMPPVEFGPQKNVRWQVKVPAGPSSPCVWGERVFLTAFDAGKLWTLCYDLTTGSELWRRDAGTEKIEAFLAGQGSPAASTAATDGERVVVYFGSCGLIAYDFDGKELWRHTLPIAETNNDFGSGTSPIIADGKVILVRDLRQDSTVLALDVKTGQPLWKTARPGMATGYSTPIVWEHDDVKELIAPGGLAMKAYDLASGSERWLVRDLPAVNCGSAVAGDGMLFFAGWSPAGEDAPMPEFKQLLAADADRDGKISEQESEKTFLKGFFRPNDTDKDGFITQSEWDALVAYLKSGTNRLIAVKPGGSGDITASHIAWEKKKGLPYVPSALLYRGSLFIVKDGGLASSFDAKTGVAKYEQERIGTSGSYYASPVAANGHIYLVNLAGKATTLATGDKLNVVWNSDFKESIAATPAIAGDTLLVRTATKLFAFKSGP